PRAHAERGHARLGRSASRSGPRRRASLTCAPTLRVGARSRAIATQQLKVVGQRGGGPAGGLELTGRGAEEGVKGPPTAECSVPCPGPPPAGIRGARSGYEGVGAGWA